MENETNLDIKEKILVKTEKTKNIYSDNLVIIENQNKLIEENYNKVVDINDELKESSSIIRKIKRGLCDCFKSKPKIKKDNMNKIIITNNNSKIKEKNIENNIENNIDDDFFKKKMLNELDQIHNLSIIQNEQIKNQNKILNKMNNNTNIVNNKIKKNNNEIKKY